MTFATNNVCSFFHDWNYVAVKIIMTELTLVAILLFCELVTYDNANVFLLCLLSALCSMFLCSYELHIVRVITSVYLC